MKSNLPARLPSPTERLTATLLFAIFLVGCGPQQQPAEDEPVTPDSTAAEPTDASEAAVPEITVQVVDADGYQAVIDRHRGKVVLVDFWATWCDHCVEFFPDTVQLHREFADDGLAVVSVSLDDLEDEAEMQAKLVEFGATFDNLLSQYDDSLKTMEAMVIEGGIPFYKLYDRQGQLRHEFGDTDPDNPLKTVDIKQRVEELLAEQP